MMPDLRISGSLFLICASFLAIAAAAAVVLRGRLQVKRLLRHLEDMLEQAQNGSFSADTIDETMLSSLEFKFCHFLSASVVSAQETEKEKEKIKELVSDISHQTKTPVASLLLYCDLLKERDLDKESRGYVEAVSSQAQKLRFLIDSLVKMSRLETGVLALHPQAGAIMPVVSRLYGQYAVKAHDKGLYFEIISDSADADLHAVFDEKWTLEAFGNLVDNAVKYTQEGGITITVKAFELFCCIRIADTGMGILEAEQAQVFSRFYRSMQAAQTEGAGIGLYLAREIITRQNGYIRLSSEPGNGSVFAVYLPMGVTG